MPSYRPLTEEISSPTSVNTATTLNDANIVRAVNTNSNAALLTLVSSSGDVVGSMTITGGESVLIDKAKSQKVYASTANVKITSVSYPQG